MIVRWTPLAADHLDSLHAYIAKDNEDAAAATVRKILAAAEALARYPEIGQAGRVRGTRELVVGSHIVVYKLDKGVVELMTIMHGARRWPIHSESGR